MADEPVTESNGEATGAAAPDDTRQKFREALERKKANAGGGAAHKDGGHKQPRAHGPQESRREFRRKSG